MEFEWDPVKAAANLAKHGVRFAEAPMVLEDESAVTVDEEHAGEFRQVTVGMDALGRLLVVVHVFRDPAVRIISVRRATRREREQFEVRP